MSFFWNPLNEPVFKAAPKLLLTEFGLRDRLESSEGPLELEEVGDVRANRAGTLTIRQNYILLVSLRGSKRCNKREANILISNS